jgi:hypothetical protein
MSENIYDMKLHDEISLNSFVTIRRVPGGWLYIDFSSCSPNSSVTSTFVPSNSEFTGYNQDKNEKHE